MTEKEYLQVMGGLTEAHQYLNRYRWINGIFKPSYNGYYLCLTWDGARQYDVLYFMDGHWMIPEYIEVLAWKHIEPYEEAC